VLERLRLLPILVALTIATGAAQQPASFEVASVKRSLADSGLPRVRNVLWPPGGRMTATGLTVRELIRSAYMGDGIQLMTQVVGGPSWIDTDRFDIIAKMAEVPTGSPEDITRQHNAVLRSLLADRFGVKLHPDTRALPVFDLVLARKDGTFGPQLKASTCDRQAGAPSAATSEGPRPCVPFRMLGMNPAVGITMGAEGVTMSQFGAALVGFPEIDRLIRDRTGLVGAFDLQLTLAMPVPPAGGVGNGAQSPPSMDSGILTALPEQLGLKLEGRQDQVNVIVIDSVEQPTAD
jgi:uncharacterized protein (TIGR03435 family)